MSYRAFWQRRCRAAAAEAVLKPLGGNYAVLPLFLLYNPGKAKGKGLRSVLRQFMRFCCAKHA
jgi:hypothetical protein